MKRSNTPQHLSRLMVATTCLMSAATLVSPAVGLAQQPDGVFGPSKVESVNDEPTDFRTNFWLNTIGPKPAAQ
jgi:hypothetical protein